MNPLKFNRLTSLVLVGAALVVAAGCGKKEAAPAAKPGRVSATPAYEKYFGTPPTSDKGTCFAFVIYFPLAKDHGRVIPFPFFTFDEASIKKVAAERLLGGMDIPAYRGEFVNPFPRGTHLISLTEKDGVVTVEMSLGSKKGAMEAAGRNALALTLNQFSDVKGIETMTDGIRSPVKLPRVAAVKAPGPPRLLGVTASKEKGAKEIEDVSVLFDRPLEIGELELLSREGKRFEGDMYHSVFDMAAVLKPRQPGIFTPGLPVRVRWKVVDRKGRSSKGETVLRLEVHEH
jgi:hypothetical protein